MELTLDWQCDGCGRTKAVKYSYDWQFGLGDVWHPTWLRGYGNEIFCVKCYEKAWDADIKANPGIVVTG